MRQAVGFVGAMVLVATAASAAPPSRQLLTVPPGGSATVAGLKLDAAEASVAIVHLSSEFATVAVISGRISADRHDARAGEALLAPLDGGRIRRFGFDAQRLAATLPFSNGPCRPPRRCRPSRDGSSASASGGGSSR